MFSIGNSFENEVHLDVFLSRIQILSTEIFFILLRIFQIVVKVHVLSLQFQFELFNHLIDFLFDHHFGNIDGCIVNSFLQNFVVKGFRSFKLSTLFKASANVGLQFVNSLEFAYKFRKVGIDGRQFAAFNILNSYGKHGFLTCQILLEVIFRERNFYILAVTGFQTDELFFKAGNKAARTDLQRICLTFTAFKGNAVNGSLKVDNGIVTVFNFGTFRSGSHFCMCFLQVYQFFGNVFICYFNGFLSSLNAFIFTQFNFRFFRKRSFKDEVFALFIANAVNIRIRYGRNSLFLKSIVVRLRCNHFKNFFFYGIFT